MLVREWCLLGLCDMTHLTALSAHRKVTLDAGENGDSKPSGMHVSGEDAGKAAARAGVRKLILTHIPPWGDGEGAVRGAAKHFDGDIELARQGMRVQL